MAEDDSEWRQHSFNRSARRHEDYQWREYAAIRVAQEHTDPGPSEVRPGIQEYRQVQVVDSTLSGWETGFEWEMSSSGWEQHARDREERRNIDLDWREYAMARVEQREIFRTMTVLVEVPAGVSGGDTIEFASEGRDEMNQVVVPEGLCQGDVFEVDVPHEEPEVEAASFRTPASADEIQEQEHVEVHGEAGAAAMEQLVVVIPEGVGSGDAIEVVSSGGSRFVVEVPPGLGSGMELSVSVPCDTLSGSPPEGSAARGDAPTGHGEAHWEAYGESHASPGRVPKTDCGSSLHIYPSEELREPSAEPGYRYYAGQHIRMPRKRGGFSDGVVLEVVDTFETLYRCRIGAKQPGTEALEKHCLEDEIMPSRPQPGFELCVGQMVRVARLSDRRVVFATVLEPCFVEDEPSYRLLLAPADVAEATFSSADSAPVIETHSEEDIRMKSSTAPGSAFFLGQLVQVRAENGAYTQLARVCEFHVSPGQKVKYVCRTVADGWGIGIST